MRIVPAAVTALCGIASLMFMMMVGRNQKSVVLIAMFSAWVAAPFAIFLCVQFRGVGRNLLAWSGALLALASAAIYAVVVFGPSRPQPAKFFLLVPAGSLVLFGMAGLVTGRETRS